MGPQGSASAIGVALGRSRGCSAALLSCATRMRWPLRTARGHSKACEQIPGRVRTVSRAFADASDASGALIVATMLPHAHTRLWPDSWDRFRQSGRRVEVSAQGAPSHGLDEPRAVAGPKTDRSKTFGPVAQAMSDLRWRFRRTPLVRPTTCSAPATPPKTLGSPGRRAAEQHRLHEEQHPCLRRTRQRRAPFLRSGVRVSSRGSMRSSHPTLCTTIHMTRMLPTALQG